MEQMTQMVIPAATQTPKATVKVDAKTGKVQSNSEVTNSSFKEVMSELSTKTQADIKNMSLSEYEELLAQIIALLGSTSDAQTQQILASLGLESTETATTEGMPLLSFMNFESVGSENSANLEKLLEALKNLQQNLQTAQTAQNSTVPQETKQALEILQNALTQNVQKDTQSTQSAKSNFDALLTALKLQTGETNTQEQKVVPTVTAEQLQQSADNMATQGDLQAKIGNSVILPPTTQSTADTETAKSIFTQVMSNLTQNITNGKNEFTVKLSPEGLGELTVKLVETSGGMNISILASSAETARLLTGEIANLRAALQPYQSEQNTIIVAETQESEADLFNSTNEFNNQRSTHEFLQRQNMQEQGMTLIPDLTEADTLYLGGNIPLSGMLSARV